MPIMDGFTATRTIKQHAQTCRIADLTIIACTALSEAQNKRKCQAAGMDAFLAKPITLEKLRKLLRFYRFI